MSVELDKHFSNLESVAKFLEKDDAPKSSPKEVDSASISAAEELEAQVRQQVGLFKTLIEENVQEAGTRIQDAQISESLANLRLLREEQKTLRLAIEVDEQLQKPQSFQRSLIKALETCEASPRGEIERSINQNIRSQWYDFAVQRSSENLRDVLAKTNWPKEEPPKNSAEFKNAAQKVLDLALSDSLECFEILAEGIVERLKFNFGKGRDTARADKPEWLFAYFFRLLDPRVNWVQIELRKLTDAPMDKLVLSLIPTIVAICNETYDLDSHFVSELIQFCYDLESKYMCDSEVTDQLIRSIFSGTTLDEYILSEQASFSSALDVLLRTGSHKIDFDVDCDCAKPTFVALNLREMIQQADALLRLNPYLVAQNLHLKLSQTYVDFLESELASFEKSHSSLARAVGSKKEPSNDSISDIEVLGRLLGAASFTKSFLEGWSCNLQVAPHFSTVQGQLDSLADIRSRAAIRISSLLTREAQKNLKSYLRIDWSRWTESEGDSVGDSIIRAALDGLRPSMTFVNRLCPNHKSDRLRVVRPFADALAEIIWRLVLQANVFTRASANRLESDIETLWAALDVPRSNSYYRITEAAKLLHSEQRIEPQHLSREEVEGLNSRRVHNNAVN